MFSQWGEPGKAEVESAASRAQSEFDAIDNPPTSDPRERKAIDVCGRGSSRRASGRNRFAWGSAARTRSRRVRGRPRGRSRSPTGLLKLQSQLVP